ncbi:MAG: hypothetical protein HKN33_16410 [Pyrinomonadaceae bacterium]|nr:hypothetical protein [Pyrinomonadaceae bacterium]
MVARLVVILFVLVCLMMGFVLVLFPWFSFGGFGEWGDNFLLGLLVDQTGLESIRTVVSSAWFRGGVTGLGIFNIFLAFWEVAHFDENVAALEKG